MRWEVVYMVMCNSLVWRWEERGGFGRGLC